MYTASNLTPSDFAHLLHHSLISEKLKQRIRENLPQMTKEQIVILANELWKAKETVRSFNQNFRKNLATEEKKAKAEIDQIIIKASK